MIRDVKKLVFFAFEIFHEIFQFLKSFFEIFHTAKYYVTMQENGTFFTSNTVNDSMIGKQATMIILCFMYASLE